MGQARYGVLACWMADVRPGQGAGKGRALTSMLMVASVPAPSLSPVLTTTWYSVGGGGAGPAAE